MLNRRVAYGERASAGVITDRESTPDIDVLAHGIEERIEELLALAANADHLDTIEQARI
jgi:hypothetical protein